MNKTPIVKMLALIVECKPSAQASHQYRHIQEVLKKDTQNITYTEKLSVREDLRCLCVVAGLSYERLLMRVCK